MISYRIFKPICWAICHACARVRVEGAGNVPPRGPFFLVFNHQSILDPLLAQAHCRPIVYSMTKSTQFAHPLFRWLVPRVGGFPVRRYRVDPQAVRTALRYLDEGKVVGVYPEGERTWDGRIQPFRRGSVKLFLYAGVPVVPVGIEGSFDVWPRWASGPRRGRITVRYGPPLDLGHFPDRLEREREIPRAAARLSRALADLIGAEAETPDEREWARLEAGEAVP